MNNKEKVLIQDLSPSASRLLLALLSSSTSETHDSVIIRSGIKSWSTYLKAKEQLLNGRYLEIASDGRMFAKVKP